jgi:hypothetical protein
MRVFVKGLQPGQQVPGILRALTSAPGGSIADSPAMRLAVMAAFSVSNVEYSADGRNPGCVHMPAA